MWPKRPKSFPSKVLSLQMDLDNSVAVQNDFVRLSQSLQVELEKIRQAESEVSFRDHEIDDENSLFVLHGHVR